MPNVAPDHAPEPESDEGSGGTFNPLARRPSRRTRAVAGVVGLAALLGGGTYVAVSRLTHDAPETRAADNGTLPLAAPTITRPAPNSGATRPNAGRQATTTAPATSATVRTAAERVAAARAAAAKDGVRVIHPLTPTRNPSAMTAAAQAKVENSGSLKQGSTMRVITAKADLTGLREQGWVAGGVTPHGPADCSQTFRFGNELKAAKKPTLLVCWRTSAKKSVITVAVDVKGHPSVAKSVAVIDKRWRQLG